MLFLHDCGNKVETIRSKICGVSWHHMLRTGHVVAITHALDIALDGMHREDPKARQALPVWATMLWHEHKSLDHQVPHQQSIWGATLLGYFFLLRLSKYLGQRNVRPRHGIKLSDIRFSCKDGAPTQSLKEA